eukprot:TRINITY_DN1773_c0_g1_i1.p1 TRINITY_DN1773_c0_g1~~TRINITY_DN1773_c0_g1_i1.p1  ORF type:complete len:525 (-),score=156.16 TRINITY_DN1773_c0_g1_i1:200-1774(-)
MFGWTRSKQQDAVEAAPLPSYDPLKGNRGAIAFYATANGNSYAQHQDQVQDDESSSQQQFRAVARGGGSAASFYASRLAASAVVLSSGSSSLEGSPAEASPAASYAGASAEGPGAAPGVEEVDEFLSFGKLQLQDSRSRSLIRVVVGNAEAELDSIASSIVHAFILNRQAVGSHGGASSGSGLSSISSPGYGGSSSSNFVVTVPVVNMPRKDFHLRPEAVWFLEQNIGLNTANLLFSDEINVRGLYGNGRLQLVLVNHSKLPPSMEGLEKAIVEIIDNKPADEVYAWVTDKTISNVGSCSTLVAERISELNAGMFGNIAICRLLLAGILSETSNLDVSERIDARDETMAALLINGAGHLGRNLFFEKLREKKFDQLGLTTEELLRSSFRQWAMGPGAAGRKGETVNVGVAEIHLPLSQFAGKDQTVGSILHAFIAIRSLHVLIILSQYHTPSKKLKRELAVCSELPGLLNGLCFFLQHDRQNLKLKLVSVRGLPVWVRVFTQGNLTASRSLMVPLLLAYFASGQ